ncbi:sarcosine oxidase subunit gamma [Amycolatopsis jiangsuensis]|uniref:Sarcosine oxidase subunit gamma n=1 Tax=Amycolatopsis jiangsuensis TaxID=1181879 RepID=A0A840IRT5_9PSEU|nr:sarcosine oxidase subunit gamma family protein [Amycolatopsis jiangsuensis]MBB4684097.1 sarcosine oxidase subunit gamma [Amycolatopsis jiangsuensis]
MAEVLYPTHPLETWAPALDELSRAGLGLVVTLEPPVSAVDVRLDATGPGADAFGRAVGTALPLTPNTWTHTADGQIIWLSPDEWLVTAEDSPPHELEDELGWVLSAYDGAAVDVSAQRTALRVRGHYARDLLSFGCSLDLRPTAFPRGSAAQTAVGQTAVLLLALGEQDLRLFVRPSFAGYLAEWILDAAQEYRPAG